MKKLFVFVMLVALVLLTGCVSQATEEITTPEPVIETIQPTVIELNEDYSVGETQIPTEEPKELTLSLVVVQYDSWYLPSLEYLELGEVVESCQHPYNDSDGLLSVEFGMLDKTSSNGAFYKYDLSLNPSQYRALKSALGEKYAEYKDKYLIKAIVQDDVVISLGDITDQSGNTLWNLDSMENPRELNDLEVAYLLYESVVYGIKQEDYLDLNKHYVCDDIWDIMDSEGGRYYDWSPLELEARYTAASIKYNLYFVSTNDEKFWISYMYPGLLDNCGDIQPTYRWVDEIGQMLTPLSCSNFRGDIEASTKPKSVAVFAVPTGGIVILQEHIGENWETILEVKISGGDVVYNRYSEGLITVGEINRVFSDDPNIILKIMAILTEGWSNEEIMDQLFSIYD